MRKPTLERNLYAGRTQRIYRFDNGYGASVIQWNEGVVEENEPWEIAVIKYFGDGATDYRIDFGTEIADDLITGLSDGEVDGWLARIEKLPNEQ